MSPEYPEDNANRAEEVLNSLPILVTTHLGDGEGTYTGAYSSLQVKNYESPKQLVGESLANVLADEPAATLLDTIETVLQTGGREYVEFPVHFGGERYLRGAFVSPLAMPTAEEPGEVIVVGFDLSRWDERYRLLYSVLAILGQTASRTRLEQAFCDQLVEQERYEMAWLGVLDAEESVTVRASSNADEYTTELREQCDGLTASHEPGVRALFERKPVVVRDLEPIDTRWATVARAHDLQTVVALPLVHQGVEHGVLSVYTSDAEYLVPWREAVLEEYAEAVGYALSAGLWRWALATDTAATLEISVPGGMALAELCSRAGVDEVTVRSVVPRDGETLYYVSSTQQADICAAATAIERMRPYTDEADAACGVVVESKTPERKLVQRGSQFHTFRVRPGDATLRVSVPRAGDVQTIAAELREAYPDVRLSVQWGQTDQSDDGPTMNPAARLTDRQYEVLVAAYQNGYFQVDRDHNATEIAEMLDISRWTFSEHLRRAQSKLFDNLLGVTDS